jgi:hypothetical protein
MRDAAGGIPGHPEGKNKGSHSTPYMKNDDFWKSQFVKHDATPGTGKPPTTPAPPKPPSNPVSVGSKAVSTTEEPSTSRMEKMLQAVRSTQSTLSFEKFVSLVLSKFPAKTRTQWEQWLLNQKAALVKKWHLSE